jgi:adenylyltransferase/sulfurtransferase
MTINPRYVRQTRFAAFGEAGQLALQAGRALVCGCGALGSVLAESLTRAGVGHLRLVDRDFLEITNLHRQVLYDEDDVAAELPKAIAAQRKLRRINSTIDIEAHVCDVDFTNIESLLDGVDCIVDGTDNFETRFLLNDAAHRYGIPWVYGGCIGAEGQQMTIVPGRTPCLRCLVSDVPPPGTTPTCDTAGVLGPIVNVIASLQAMEAIKLLSGNESAISRTLNVVELWDSRLRQINLDALRENSDCLTCGQGIYPWLAGEKGSHTSVLCGRNAVQLTFPERGQVSLPGLAEKLQAVGKVSGNEFLLRLEVDDYKLTVFPDGRAIVGGTEDVAEAKTVYAKYVGF